MQCLFCGNKIARLRYWKLKSEFCSEEHAELHKRQTLDRLMQSQEDLLSHAAPPLLHVGDDSELVAPDFEPRLSEPVAPQPKPIDTRPRIDRSHQLPAAQRESLSEPAASGLAPGAGVSESPEAPRVPAHEGAPDESSVWAGREQSESGESSSAELEAPLQRLREATASKPIVEDSVAEASGELASEGSSDHDAVLRRLMGDRDEESALSDPSQASHEDEESFERFAERMVPPGTEDSTKPGSGSPQPVDLAPLESVEVDVDASMRSRMEETTAQPVFPESEVTAPAETGGDHDAIVARLMDATGDERPALSDLLEGIDESSSNDAEFADAPAQAAPAEPAEASSPLSKAASNFSLQELLDGLDTPGPSKAREQVVPISESGKGTPVFSDELMPPTPPAARSWDEVAGGSEGSDHPLETWGGHEPATPNYEAAPIGADTLNILDCRGTRRMATPDSAGSFANCGTQWMTGEPSFRDMTEMMAGWIERLPAVEAVDATAPSLAVSIPSFDAKPARRQTGPGSVTLLMSRTPDFVEISEAADESWQLEEVSTEPLTPSGTIALPDSGIIAAASTSPVYALSVSDGVSSRSGVTAFLCEEVCEVAPITAGEDMTAPAAACRVPEARIDSLTGGGLYRGIVLAEMVSWVNPNTMGQLDLPVFANWTGGAEQPLLDIEVPVVLLTGAIRSVRQFPRFGYLLQSATGKALIEGLRSGDTSGILPVFPFNEEANQPQPFSVLALESQETELEVIGPAGAVYAPADLDPREYA